MVHVWSCLLEKTLRRRMCFNRSDSNRKFTQHLQPKCKWSQTQNQNAFAFQHFSKSHCCIVWILGTFFHWLPNSFPFFQSRDVKKQNSSTVFKQKSKPWIHWFALQAVQNLWMLLSLETQNKNHIIFPHIKELQTQKWNDCCVRKWQIEKSEFCEPNLRTIDWLRWGMRVSNCFLAFQKNIWGASGIRAWQFCHKKLWIFKDVHFWLLESHLNSKIWFDAEDKAVHSWFANG